jgi:hypothetical protein
MMIGQDQTLGVIGAQRIPVAAERRSSAAVGAEDDQQDRPQ